jgi:hypothetical protein
MARTLWRTGGWLWITCGWLWITCACGDDDARATTPPEPPERAGAAQTDDEAALDPEAEGEALGPTGDVAEPTEREQLEAECFHGSTEACDRLGH